MAGAIPPALSGVEGDEAPEVRASGLGWQLAQKMRMSRETAKIPIIICTAATKDAREQEGWLAAQSIKIVLKPFSVDDLDLAITKALRLPDLVT